MANDLMFRPAIELAAMVRDGEVAPRELVQAAYEAIERRNGELNAFVTLCRDRALAEADAIEAGDERPLAGEELLLSLSAQLEVARPWADRRPELATA